MKALRLAAARLPIATLAAACTAMVWGALVNWTMTARFSLSIPWPDVLWVGVRTFGACLLCSVILAALLVAVRRRWPVGRGWAAVSGGVLFWFIPAALVRDPLTALLAVPIGLAAGFFLGRDDGRVIGWRSGVVLAGGLGVWLVLLAIPGLSAWREYRYAHRPANDAILGGSVVRGAVFGNELWLLNRPGKVASFRLADWHPTLRVASDAIALASDGATMWLLSAPSREPRVEHQPAGSFRLAAYRSGHWSYAPRQAYGPDERPIALAFDHQGTVVLGPQRLYFFRGTEAPATRALSRPLAYQAEHSTALIVGNSLYVGRDQGEFGGGLWRVDLATGLVTEVARRDDQQWCTGPLNAECDPVTALVADPDKPDCIFASVGLAHMSMSTGRVVRVCGDHVEQVFASEIAPIGTWISRLLRPRKRALPAPTEPVYGLAPAPHGFWAITPRALYRWDNGRIERHALPDLTPVHGLAVSTAMPGLVVATTEADAVAPNALAPLLFAAK